MGWAVWRFKHGPIVKFFFTMKLNGLKPFVLLHVPGARDTSDMLQAAIAQAQYVEFGNFVLGLAYGGLFWTPILVSAFVLFAFKAHWHPVGNAYRVLDASGLLRVMAENFSYNAPTLKLDLLSKKVPGWEPVTNPDEFVAEHALMRAGELDKDRARELFIKRLGSRLQKPHDLKRPHERILMSIFAEACWGNRKDAFTWLDKMNWASCNDKGKPDFSDGKLVAFFAPHFDRWAKDKRVLQELSYHAYRDTFLSQLLYSARWKGNKGKLATSFFIWLRPTDRQLFFVLNGEGRDVSWAEGAHAYAQLQAERVAREMGWRMTAPFVASAVEGLESELIKYNVIRPKVDAEDLFTAPVVVEQKKSSTGARRRT
jgi:intracellular multiplication protein IcmP